MTTNRELSFFLYVVVGAVLWVPVSAWLMPRFGNAPAWDENPMYYVSATIMGVGITYILRLAFRMLRKRRSSEAKGADNET